MEINSSDSSLTSPWPFSGKVDAKCWEQLVSASVPVHAAQTATVAILHSFPLQKRLSSEPENNCREGPKVPTSSGRNRVREKKGGI